MCTQISLSNKYGSFSSRTMDFSIDLSPSFVFVPRGYEICFADGLFCLDRHYAFMGMGKKLDRYILADGINEHGLSCTALYFENYAQYNKKANEDKINLYPQEFLNFVLGKLKNVDEFLDIQNELHIIEDKIDFIGKTPSLHWVISDADGNSIIVEPTNKEVQVSEDKVGVLTNSPDISWHYTNLNNYIHLSPLPVKEQSVESLVLKHFGQASGSIGLPGDYTSPSRFIRALFNKANVDKGRTAEDLLSASIATLNTVSIPRGVVKTFESKIDYTQYTCYMDLKSLIYYYKTYDNNNIRYFRFKDFNKEADSIEELDLGGGIFSSL